MKFTTPAVILKTAGFDVYGARKPLREVSEKVNVLRMVLSQAHTTVRADNGGSRGHAEEELSDLWALVSKNTRIEREDVLRIAGTTFRVMSLQPRFDLSGRLDHHELKGMNEPANRQS